MKYKQYSPPAVLQPYVRYFWSFDSFHSTASKLLNKSFADRYPRLIFQNLNQFNPISDTAGKILPQCYLSGIDTTNTECVMPGTFSHFGVSFFPHALNAFFQIEAHELVNKMPDIRFFSQVDIQSKLEQAKSHETRVQIVSRYLYDKIYCGKKKRDQLVSHIIQQNEIHESTNVYEVIRKYKVSERQLERKFKTSIGISPKKLQRIVRFEKSLQLLAQADYKQLTSIAYKLDYTDQSHFIKDFKDFSGMTPYEFVKCPNLGSDSSSFIYNSSNKD